MGITLPTLVSNVSIGTIASGTDDERTVFIAPTKCFIEKIYITVGSTMTAGATNFVTLTLKSKGSAGTGTTAIAEFDTDTGNTTVTKFVPLSFGALSNNVIEKGEAITLDKVEDGTGDVLDEAVITVVYRASSGMHQFTS